jgi:Mg2+-importing ATPase
VRDGREQEIPLAHIVPGDVVLYTPGDLIAADCEVIHARDFFVNESSLTGESFPAEHVPHELVCMGSSVVIGSATTIARATGAATKFGKIVDALEKKDLPTEFDRSISEFSRLIMKVTFLLVLFVFFANAYMRGNVFESFLFAAALAVGLTPELLPMIIAINLSRGSVTMARHGAIVKRLSAIQNCGSMDVLCTDKTGTLTEDKITLVKYIDAEGRESEDVFRYAYISSTHLSGFKSPLDSAIKAYKTLDMNAYEKIDEIPFDYVRKRESVIIEHAGTRTMISKGAPEEIMKICASEHNAQASVNYQNLSKDGFRVLAVCAKELREKKEVYSKSDESDMAFVGFVAFIDPPKATVSETLAHLERVGIEIKILTGDNELVSQKIASDIHLPSRGILLGAEIEQMDDKTLAARVEHTTIFARVTPDQKTRLIEIIQKNGHVVGYMGDGINDAPALKAADVGISVNNAVDVAKDTADIILLHKSLKDLAGGVIEGRKTFTNTFKYLTMALSSNFGNMLSMAGASVFLPFLPMTSVQILLNNLLYDVSQFAIPVDHVDSEDVQKPRRFNISFIQRFMPVFGLASSIFDFITFYFLFFVFNLQAGSFQAGWFMESLATQTFVIYVIRTRRLPFIKSSPSIALLVSTIGAVTVGWFIALSSVGYIFKFSVLPFHILAVIVGIVVVYLVCVEVLKRWFWRRFAVLAT